jgi:hypothetical protein
MRKGIAIAATALIALAASTTPAQAASSSTKCKQNAKHGKVIKKGSKSLVFELTHKPKILQDYFYGCSYKTGKSYKLPNQDGGDTLHPRHFVFKGDLLAYTVLDIEPAGASAYQEVLLVNVRKRKRLVKESAFEPPANDPDATFGASSAKSLLVDTRGFVAWIGQYRRMGKTSYNVQVAGAGFTTQILDTGDGIAGKSLKFSSSHSTLSWTKDGVVHSSPFPPPVPAR